MILQPGIAGFCLLFAIASAMNINDDNIIDNINNINNNNNNNIDNIGNDELFANVLIEAEAEVDQITLDQTMDGHQSRLVPGHSRRGVSKQSMEMERRNDIVKLATKKAAELLEVDLSEAAHQLRLHMRQTSTFISDLCTDTAVPCTSQEKFSKFRTLSGHCNNIQNNMWGTPNIPQRRILSICQREFFTTRNTLLGPLGPPPPPPPPGGGGGSPPPPPPPPGGGGGLRPPPPPPRGGKRTEDEIKRQSSCPPAPFMATGKCPLTNVLPNPRLVSSAFHTDADNPSPNKLTQLFTIFAQFVDHDITLSATYNPPDCCIDASDTDKCAPITVGSGDSFYSSGKCLNFVRSVGFCEELNCGTDPMNGDTSYVDGSQIYGSDQGNGTQLRAFSGGRLATSGTPGTSLLPIVDGAFKGGDIRALENPALGSLQTIFLREHNRIAQQIQTKFPLWSDEKVFQHARRIVIAEYQNIAFGEMLPLILGFDNIFPAGATATNYNPNLDASIINEFSTAAYRFGHTLLNGKFNRVDPVSGSLLDYYLLRYNFNNETLYKQDPSKGMVSIIKGLTAQSAQAFDQFMTKEVTQFLFSNFPATFGEDLASRNIQRGRDHSINPWLSYRHWCGFPTPDDWSIRPPEISPEKWSTLRSLYLRVADIDLFTGGLAELPVPGGTVGVTFACIIQEQFQRFVAGDRYFFTHTNNVGTQLNLNQINAIRNVKISDIICKTSNIQQIQKRAFLIPSPPDGPNPLLSCSNAYNLDINAFFSTCNCQNIGSQTVDCDNRCINPATDPFNGLGCNAGGQGPTCRFCGFNNYPPC